MSFELNAEQSQFRDRARAWLAEHAPAHCAAEPPLSIFARSTEAEDREEAHAALRWQAAKAEGGWAGLTVPTRFGGQGRSVIESLLFDEEEKRYALPLDPLSVTNGMIVPTLVQWGTDAQRHRLLPDILTGRAIWCQLFSEPGAGSDLAALSTSARRVDGGWLVNGQKVWTSHAQHAAWGYLLARSERVPDDRHRGITALVVDMSAPGVTCRPLRQATGGSRFNEVFFDDVFIPEENLLGEAGNGWRVAVTTLMSERYALDPKVIPLTALCELAADSGTGPDAVTRLGRIAAKERIVTALKLQLLDAAARGQEAGPEGSIAKLVTTAALQEAAGLVTDLRGHRARQYDRWSEFVIGAPGLRIGGGTDEILRNVLAQRALGLPR